jgi:hypothetical protein
VFGLTCGPYLLLAVIQHHLKNWTNDEDIVQILKDGFYADNLVGSIDNSESYELFKERAIAILSDAGMNLREWVSNYEPAEIPTNVLGMMWNSLTDKLSVAKSKFEQAKILTRRKLSSSLQKIFDPIGILAPCLMMLKIWLQESWRLTPDWDCPLPDEMLAGYLRWMAEFNAEKPEIDRCMHLNKGAQLHVFCDASEKGYAAVIYARINGQPIELKFVQARTCLVPMKYLTIPRLELMGCLIGARLLQSTMKSLTCPIENAYLWTDSTTALSWITKGNNWSVFVRNRVWEITGLTSCDQWRHVPGEMNFADVASRGCYPKGLIAQKWWEGPAWLKNEDQWPENQYSVNEELVFAEMQKASIIELVVQAPRELDTWYLPTSSFSTNVRILAYIRRFCRRKKYASKKLSFEEYQEAETWIILQVQEDSFPDPLKLPVATIRHRGLLCVKTKLLQSRFTQAFILPIVLPDDHPVVDQIVYMEHVSACHCGPGILMGRLRRRFFIVHARKVIKRVLKNCVICQKMVAKKAEAPEGTLPPERTALSRVFSTTGIDLAGPLYCKDGSKCWLVLFICATYRAIHLEVVTTISTDDFLLAFCRFAFLSFCYIIL